MRLNMMGAPVFVNTGSLLAAMPSVWDEARRVA
jgi:hypothetical protein